MIKIQCLNKNEVYFTFSITVTVLGNLRFKDNKTNEYIFLESSKVLSITIANH